MSKVEFSDELPCDFAIAKKVGVLFITLKFHRSHPEYLASRIKDFRGAYSTRILLLLVNAENYDRTISMLTVTAIANNLSLILAFHFEEASRWLMSMYASQENQLDDLKAVNETPYEMAVDAINALGPSKKEAESLLDHFSNVQSCIMASKEELANTGIINNNKIETFVQSVSAPFV